MDWMGVNCSTYWGQCDSVLKLNEENVIICFETNLKQLKDIDLF